RHKRAVGKAHIEERNGLLRVRRLPFDDADRVRPILVVKPQNRFRRELHAIADFHDGLFGLPKQHSCKQPTRKRRKNNNARRANARPIRVILRESRRLREADEDIFCAALCVLAAAPAPHAEHACERSPWLNGMRGISAYNRQPAVPYWITLSLNTIGCYE